LVTWVSQATFKPPGITVAIAKERSIEYLMYIGSKFVLNIFSEGIHTDYIKSFRRNFTPIEYHLSGIRTIVGENSSPILADAAAYLECSVNQHLDCGDHWVIYATVDYGKLINPDGVTALTLPALKRKGFLAKI
jgi:flavin reductase (DIM6/NTAB) family NADH-FMN oxidoreductase RutF